MIKARKRKTVRFIAKMLTVIMLVPHLLTALGTSVVLAQVQGADYVAVLDFANASRSGGQMPARLATDAVAVELAKSDKFTVASRRQIADAMNNLDLQPPLNVTSIVRLAKELGVSSVITGTLRSVEFTNNPRQAKVEMEVRMLDAETGEAMNGAIARGQSTPVPNFTGDDDVLLTQAINNAAYVGVNTMLSYIIPEATVLNSIGDDRVLLNKGAQDGIRRGMEMLVSRDGETVGRIRILEVSNNDATANVLPGSTRGVHPQDKARAIFKLPDVATGGFGESPSTVSGGVVGGGKKRGTGRVAGLLLGLGILALLASQSKSSESVGPGGAATGLRAEATSAMSSPAVRVTLDPSRFARTGLIQYKIWRDDLPTPVFGVDPNISMVNDPDLPVGTTLPVTFLRVDPNDTSSAPDEVSATNPGITPGRTYNYYISGVYKILTGLGGGSDSGTGGGTGGTSSTYKYQETTQQFVGRSTPLEQITRANMLTPTFNAQDIDLQNVTFAWNAVAGADRYIVEVSTNPAFSNVRFRSSAVTSSPSAAGTQVTLGNQNIASFFSGITSGTPLYWRVGAVNSLDVPGPVPDALSGLRYVYSEVSQFRTKEEPPPPPGGGSGGGSGGGGGGDTPPPPPI
ncbi:MAG: hypothetical protein IT209_13185 [Armatimonadetes bacterium]|nr:hypothetical protein [Armatimonadota bacterium]